MLTTASRCRRPTPYGPWPSVPQQINGWCAEIVRQLGVPALTCIRAGSPDRATRGRPRSSSACLRSGRRSPCGTPHGKRQSYHRSSPARSNSLRGWSSNETVNSLPRDLRQVNSAAPGRCRFVCKAHRQRARRRGPCAAPASHGPCTSSAPSHSCG